MISKLILGTVQFGLSYGINNPTGKPKPDDVKNMLDFAKDNGIQALDTADAYGNAPEIIGSYFKKNGSKFTINTKFKGNNKALSEQLEESLFVLNIDKVETYFFHSFNDFIIHANYIDQLLILKEKQLINKIGVSVYNNEEFITAINSQAIDVIQLPFNLLDNIQQRGELMKLAKIKGKELQVRSVFLQGLFFKKLFDIPPNLLPLKPYLHKLKEITGKYNVNIEKLALNYALQQPEIDYVIIGVDNLSQLKKNIELVSKEIEIEIIEEVNKIKVEETKLLYPKNWN